jgi:hypothetical protein
MTTSFATAELAIKQMTIPTNQKLVRFIRPPWLEKQKPTQRQ